MPLFNEEGALVATFATLRDITENKGIEELKKEFMQPSRKSIAGRESLPDFIPIRTACKESGMKRLVSN